MNREHVALDPQCYWCSYRADTGHGDLIALRDGTHLCDKCATHGPELFYAIVPITLAELEATGWLSEFPLELTNWRHCDTRQNAMMEQAYMVLEGEADIPVSLPEGSQPMTIKLMTMVGGRVDYVPAIAFVTRDGIVLTHHENFC